MANEEKLKKVLQVAVKNGWKTENKLQECIIEEYESFSISSNCLVGNHQCYEDYKEFSLNDLVTNWEYEEKCFIKVLVTHSERHFKGLIQKQEDLVCFEDLELWENVVQSWTLKKEYCRFKQDYKITIRPTSERLVWLFETFKHLI